MAKRKRKKQRRGRKALPPKNNLVTKLKKSIPIAIITALFGVVMWAYPLYMDYKDGKWGGAIEVGVLNGENSELALKEDSPVYIYYSVPEGAKNSKTLVPVQLQIHNSANVADKRVRLSIQYEKESLRPSIPEKFMVSSGYGLKSDSLHEVVKSKGYDYSVYAYSSLPQNSRRNIVDAAFSYKAEKEKIFVPFFSSKQGLNVEVTTHSDRDQERNWIFRYRALEISEEEKIIEWMKKWCAKHIALDLRKNTSLMDYLIGIIFNKEILVFSVTPKFVYLEEEDIYLPKEDPEEYTAFKFSPYVWKLIFKNE